MDFTATAAATFTRRADGGPGGGLSPARKIIAFAEQFRFAISHAAQIPLDVILTAPNFGVQECPPFSERTLEVFEGRILDEKAAAKYPFKR